MIETAKVSQSLFGRAVVGWRHQMVMAGKRLAAVLMSCAATAGSAKSKHDGIFWHGGSNAHYERFLLLSGGGFRNTPVAAHICFLSIATD